MLCGGSSLWCRCGRGCLSLCSAACTGCAWLSLGLRALLPLCGTTSAGGTGLSRACLSLCARLTRLGCGTRLARLGTLNCARLVCCPRRTLESI